jgi:Fe-S-cluster containining protein
MLRDAVLEAAARPDVQDAVLRVYGQLQREIDLRRPVCNASGRCCRFEAFGHRLYVTTLELAAFVRGLRPVPRPWDGTGCPYQVEGLCSVHPIRPFGCRIFFCDAGSEQWQHERYERFHRELKRLHETLAVPYLYVEWRQALAALGETVLPPGPVAGVPAARPSLRGEDGASAGQADNDGGAGAPARLSLPQLPF